MGYSQAFSFIIIFFNFNFLNVYFETVSEYMQSREGQRDGERESQAGSVLSAQSVLQDPISPPEPKSGAQMVNQLSHPGTAARPF